MKLKSYGLEENVEDLTGGDAMNLKHFFGIMADLIVIIRAFQPLSRSLSVDKGFDACKSNHTQMNFTKDRTAPAQARSNGRKMIYRANYAERSRSFRSYSRAVLMPPLTSR